MLLVGNEGMGLTPLIVEVDLERVLYQTFSLPGQPRSTSAPLRTLLADAGPSTGRPSASQVGNISGNRSGRPGTWIDAPSFIVDTLRALGCTPRNANRLFMDPTDGLRALNEVEQLARFEFATTYSSQFIRNLLFTVRPGLTELEAVPADASERFAALMPSGAYVGPRTAYFIPSPSAYVLQDGDPIFSCAGVRGGNTARAGFLVEDEDGLAEPIRDYVDKLVAPYFAAIVEWYETVGIGVTGGELW